MKSLKLLAAITCAAASGLCSLSASAQTASQTFTVVVPQNISIAAPSAVALTHDESNNNQSFGNQSWLVKGNVRNGVVVTFSTGSAFTHATDNTFKRNAKLDLGVASFSGPATWTVSKASDTTDYRKSDEVAQVEANSDGVGRANFDLGVTFITEEFGVFADGLYVTTVTGTVSAR